VESLAFQGPLLIVEDQEQNIQALRSILSDQYTLVIARNGQEALELLESRKGLFCAIILDMKMPVMDGYEFLRRKAQAPVYQNLPVLVTTGAPFEPAAEERCLALGAWDYTRKPYQPRTIQLRLANIIARSRQGLYQQLAYLSAHDAQTGLLNQHAFFTGISHTLASYSSQHFALIRLDINRFGLVNALYGVNEGDALLSHIGKVVRSVTESCPPAICARINDDIFCLCVPYEKDSLRKVLQALESGLNEYPAHYYLEPTFGVYLIDDPSLDAQVMYRRASLAARTCKNNYQNHIAYYDEALSRVQHTEQQIANEMESALESGQFVVYLQPKFDMQEDCVCGAEALVRWQHPVRGQIPPDDFVPVFERNGFIPLLDHFMWEQVCILLRKWLDAGLSPYPISVNVSRQNLYNPHLVQQLLTLVRRYNLPPELMQLELTETAYMDAPAHMCQTVQRLRRSGFTLLMDDFGSKYSSLNALKDIPVDILKLDIGFLAPSPNRERGHRILESVQQMADALHLPTIAEGVETAREKEFLKAIGCRYAQGFYFAHPITVAEYEALIEKQTHAKKR
jgi:EAL domain-containing protein (putative c-di-GMP-specific phosphodiesterase class I)/CheY-like chemotaxis protein/GGDEF domain-containing protein